VFFGGGVFADCGKCIGQRLVGFGRCWHELDRRLKCSDGCGFFALLNDGFA
jgi:hypothetical protein